MEKSPNNTPAETSHMTDEQQAAAWLNLAGVKDKDAEELADASVENRNANQAENSAEMDAEQDNKSSWDTLGDEVPFGSGKRSKRNLTEIDQDMENVDVSTDFGEGEYARLDNERLQVEQQTQDAAVLLSFCDINQTQEIMDSDSYGVLLENGVSLEKLFSADALFREQYDGYGYTRDREWRRGGEGQPNYMLKNLNWRQNYLSWEDVSRANEAKQAIDIVARTYFGEDSTPEDKQEFKEILREVAWDGRKELSEDYKAFLRKDFNVVSDRLLYGSKTIDAERARDITSGINRVKKCFEEERKEHDEEMSQLLTLRYTEDLCHAVASIEDYNEYGKSDLVLDARWKLAEVSDEYAEEILTALAASKTSQPDYDMAGDAEELVLNYISPQTLTKILRENDELMGSLEDKQIVSGDSITAAIKNNIWTLHHNLGNTVSYLASDLKQLGASDESLLNQLDYSGVRPGQFYAGEFMSADSSYEGAGTRFLEAGVDREKVLARIYNSDNPYPHNRDAFRPQKIYYDDKSWFDIMSERGFSATEIAETFAPDDIARRLPEFLEHGADAKELTKYMLSYRERFESGYKINEDGTREYVSANLSGEQAIRVYDKNHPEGRVINKEMMFGEDGVEYVMINLDTLADNGVTEEDIINNAPGSTMTPTSDLLGEMLDCKKFDSAKVLELGFQKYLERIKGLQESGILSEDDATFWSDKGRYYVGAMNSLEVTRRGRNDRREFARKHLEQVEEAERKGVTG